MFHCSWFASLNQARHALVMMREAIGPGNSLPLSLGLDNGSFSPLPGGNMRFWMLLVGAAASLMLAGPVSVSPALADDVNTCFKASGDEAIAACTRVIQDRGKSAKTHEDAYVNRGVEYDNKGDYDRAIADYNAAIPLDPRTDTPATIGVSRTAARVTTTALLPITPTRSGSIRNTSTPTATGAWRTSPRRQRPRHRRLHQSNPARSQVRSRLSTTGDLQNEPKAIPPEAMPTSPPPSS